MASVPDSDNGSRGDRVKAVQRAAEGYDVKQSSAWRALQQITPTLELDDVEVDPAGIVINGPRFKGAMNIYVLLKFGSGADMIESSESFLGLFEGSFEGNMPIIRDVTVNTSSFFA